jgi:ABC-2 type transport system ATP-binding protein
MEIESEIFLTTHYMEEAEDLSENVYLIDHGSLKSSGSVRELLRPFEGKVRVESRSESPDSVHIGLLWIGYTDSRNAEDYISKGCTVKPVSLDDVFLSTGAPLES